MIFSSLAVRVGGRRPRSPTAKLVLSILFANVAEGGTGFGEGERHGGERAGCGDDEAPHAEGPVFGPLIHDQLAGLQGIENRLRRQSQRYPGPPGGEPYGSVRHGELRVGFGPGVDLLGVEVGQRRIGQALYNARLVERSDPSTPRQRGRGSLYRDAARGILPSLCAAARSTLPGSYLFLSSCCSGRPGSFRARQAVLLSPYSLLPSCLLFISRAGRE
jgi:hypothetical protein